MINVSLTLPWRTIKVNKGNLLSRLNGSHALLNTRARCIDAKTVKCSIDPVRVDDNVQPEGGCALEK